MKRIIFNLLICLFIFQFISCEEDSGELNTPPPIQFYFEVYNEDGEDVVSNDKFMKLYPYFRISLQDKWYYFNGDGLNNMLSISTYSDLKKFVSFGVFCVEKDQTFIIDWGDGTTNKVKFTCDWHDGPNDYANCNAIIDDKINIKCEGPAFKYRFVK